jgi:hypothetical protein
MFLNGLLNGTAYELPNQQCRLMFKNYCKTAFRNLVRNKKFSLINIAGLAIGIASSILIFPVVNYELSYDRFQNDYNNIYQVATVNSQPHQGFTENL